MVLLKTKGKIVSRTLVQGYVFWPVESSQVSLYDWICLSHIEKHPKEIEKNSSPDVDSNDGNNKVDFHHFLKAHPLHQSHHVRLYRNRFQILLVGLCQVVIVETENITALLC